MNRFLACLLAVAAVACGGFDGSLVQKVDLKKESVTSGTIADEHDLDSGESNWSGFLNDAKMALGKEPTSLSFTSVTLQLDAAKAKNVGTLEEVLKGEVVVYVKDKETNAIFDLAKTTDPKGTGLVTLDLLGTDLTTQKDKLAKGQIKIGVRGGSAKASGDDFDAPLSVTLGVSAQ